MEKRVLILGTGNAQVDVIKFCKDQGWIVYGCSNKDGDVGQQYLDYFELVNIVDVDAVEEYAKKIKASVIYSVGSDLAMPTVTKVSERLNLPHFVSYETANICNKKNLMRNFLGNNFEGNARFEIATTLEEALQADFFPIMMKPSDSQGQRGVYRVDSKEEIIEHFNDSISHSKSGVVIMEQYLSGPEVSVNCYMVNGVLDYALVSDRISFDEFPGGIIKEHHIPSEFAKDDVELKVIDLCQRVLNKLSILNGPAYFQIIIKDDMPYILEVTPRLDGCHMWNLINHYSGVNLIQRSLRHLVDGVVEPINNSPIDGAIALKFMCQAPGTIVNQESHNINESDYPYSSWYYQDGDSVRKLNGFMEKCGYIIEEGIER